MLSPLFCHLFAFRPLVFLFRPKGVISPTLRNTVVECFSPLTAYFLITVTMKFYFQPVVVMQNMRKEFAKRSSKGICSKKKKEEKIKVSFIILCLPVFLLVSSLHSLSTNRQPISNLNTMATATTIDTVEISVQNLCTG